MTLESLTSHAEATSSTLNYLLLSILNLSSSETLAHAASHLGVSQTFVTLLRALPYHASKGRMVIPTTMTARHHINQEEVFRRGPEAHGFEDAVYDFAVEANNHLVTARELFKTNGETRVKVPREAMPVFLGAVRYFCSLYTTIPRIIMHRFRSRIFCQGWKRLDLTYLIPNCRLEIVCVCRI